MAGLIGHSTIGVGPDIVQYLTEAAKFFGATIYVTSGWRSADDQAQAMLDNWLKLERGKVYRVATLPVKDREQLDKYYDMYVSASATPGDRKQAGQEFLKLAKERVGMKSAHSGGRALDVRKHGISTELYRAITLALHEVKEGKRTDIYHFESRQRIAAVDEVMRMRWKAIKEGRLMYSAPLAMGPVWC